VRFFLAGLAVLVGAAACMGAEQEEFFPFGGVEAGEEAPDFSLRDLKGRSVNLAQFREVTPLVLVTGSYSCPLYRSHSPALERLYERYQDRVAFYVLYTIEAHPKGSPSPYTGGEWITAQNQRERIFVHQPATYQERAQLAGRCQAALGSRVPVLVDGMDNAVWQAYGSAPNAAYLIDSAGMVQARQDWLEPVLLEREIVEVVQEEPHAWR